VIEPATFAWNFTPSCTARVSVSVTVAGTAVASQSEYVAMVWFVLLGLCSPGVLPPHANSTALLLLAFIKMDHRPTPKLPHQPYLCLVFAVKIIQEDAKSKRAKIQMETEGRIRIGGNTQSVRGMM
jgi:hypothetical protein